MPFNQNQTTPIPERVREQLQFLRALARSRSENKRRQLLKKADISQLVCLAEIALNILKSKFKLTSRQKKRLIPHAEFVRRLGRLRTEKGARKLLVQKGAGHIGLLSALLTPIILEIGKSLLKKREEEEPKKEEEKKEEEDGK